MSDGPFPDSLAEMCKASAGESYRPSNGTEGHYFREWYCDRCKHDVNSDCLIYARSLAYSEKDAEYPKEWVINADGQPTCTAFAALDPK